MSNGILITNLASTLVMVGVIWFVQVVHYPLLALVPVSDAPAVAVVHQRRTAFVVAIPMTLEGLSTLALLGSRPDGVSSWMPWLGGVFLAIALGSTVFLSVPRHAMMATQPTPEIGRQLVATNWPRTIAWTLRGALGIWMLAQTVSK